MLDCLACEGEGVAVHMSAPIEKALKLIALAVGSNSSEEARTAAMAAVRLISDHKLLEQAPRLRLTNELLGVMRHARTSS